MVKHTQTICRQQPTNCLSVLDHLAGLGLKGLKDFLHSDQKCPKDYFDHVYCSTKYVYSARSLNGLPRVPSVLYNVRKFAPKNVTETESLVMKTIVMLFGCSWKKPKEMKEKWNRQNLYESAEFTQILSPLLP